MSNNDDQGRLPPPKTNIPALREEERFRDPIEALTAGLGENPALGDFIAFRQSRPDLKEAARMARQLDHEAHRVAYADDRQAIVRHMVDEAIWVHRRLGLHDRALFETDWIEIV